MESFDLRTFQLRLLDILTEVDVVCKKHDICYYLVAGTLLGAVRHQGFIPWDDDVDIAMPRPDYERFIQHAKEWLPEKLELACPEIVENYPFGFGKIQDAGTTLLERRKLQYVGGVCIDVFPLDGISPNKIKQCWLFMQSNFWGRLLYFTCRDPYKHGHGLRSLPTLCCRFCFNRNYLQKKLKQVRTKYDFNSSEWVVDHDFPRSRAIAPKAVYGTPVSISFEGKAFNGVSQPDALLSLVYGDYMVIPPHSKQKQHCYRIVKLNQSYRQYTGSL